MAYQIMGSETPVRLPIIDFSNAAGLQPTSNEWKSLADQVGKAVRSCGCFEVLFDKIPMELRRSVFEALEELFDLPLETKMKNVSKLPFHGYVGQRPHLPLFEGMGFDDANTLESVETFTTTLWPQGNPAFSKMIQSYSGQLSELDQIIRRMILTSLGMEKYEDEHINSTSYLLRVMKYKGSETNDTELGLNAHTDKNIVTILYQNQTKGLEVQSKNGDWISFNPSPESFLVIIGESLNAWTNGRLHSPYHRVMMSGNEPRYSIGLFTNPKEGYTIEAPNELVDEEHPLLFKPFDFIKFLEFYRSEAGRQAPDPLKSFCGT